MSLILASRSAARARLLAEAGVSVTLRSAEVDEALLKVVALREGASVKAVAERLAAAKALSVPAGREALVIGADQTLELDDALFDKPDKLEDARIQLLRLRGRAHRLHSAVALAQGGAIVWRSVESVSLHVRAFSDDFLDAYLREEGDAVLGCVGAYRLEGLGAQLFERVEGDYFTVLGLPLLPLLDALRAFGALAA